VGVEHIVNETAINNIQSVVKDEVTRVYKNTGGKYRVLLSLMEEETGLHVYQTAVASDLEGIGLRHTTVNLLKNSLDRGFIKGSDIDECK